MRTLPALSVRENERWTLIETISALHTGLATLAPIALRTDGEQDSVWSEAFRLAHFGIVMDGVWLEALSGFDISVSTGSSGDKTVLPADFPRTTDLSGWSVRLGYQFSIGTEKK